MSLQRMIVVSPDLFEKWKQLILSDEKLSEFDKSMKSILHNKKLNDITKWQMHKHNLMKYINFRRNNNHKSMQPNKNVKHVTGTATQTNTIFKKSREQQTDIPKFTNSETQTKEDILEEVFGDSNSSSTSDGEVFNDSIEKNEQEILSLDNDDDDIDGSIIKRVFGNNTEQTKILKERKTLNPDEYRVFELDNGETLTVTIENNKRILRSGTKRHASGQTTLNFPIVKKPGRSNIVKSNSTPVKMKWQQYK